MARMRTLKPQFFLNEGLAEIEPIGRLLFQGLWCLADREGRLEDRPRRIKAEVLPYDDVDVDGLLDQLGRGGFIERYDVGGSRYILISTFTKHQSPHCKEAESIIPAPGEHHSSTVQAPGQAPGKHDTSTVPAPPVTLTVPETVSDPGVDTFGGDTHRERMAPVASAAPTHGALALDPSPAPQLTTPQLTTPQPAVRAPARSPAKLVPLASISSGSPRHDRRSQYRRFSTLPSEYNTRHTGTSRAGFPGAHSSHKGAKSKEDQAHLARTTVRYQVTYQQFSPLRSPATASTHKQSLRRERGVGSVA